MKWALVNGKCFPFLHDYTNTLLNVTVNIYIRDFNAGRLDNRDMNVYNNISLVGISPNSFGIQLALRVHPLKRVKVETNYHCCFDKYYPFLFLVLYIT